MSWYSCMVRFKKNNSFNFWSYHNHWHFGTCSFVLLNDIIQKHDFSHLHSDVILIPKKEKRCWECFTLKLPYSQLHAFTHWCMATYVPAFRSETTEGLIQMGGTRIRVNIRSFGLPTSGFIINRGISCRQSKYHTIKTLKLKS